VTGKRGGDELRGLEPSDDRSATSSSAAVSGTAAIDVATDIALIAAFGAGKTNLGALADSVFFGRHPERNHAPIAAHEQAAVAEWKAIRARAAALFPMLATPRRTVAPNEEDAIVLPVLTALLAAGNRDPAKLTDEALYALNPARKRGPIGRGETAAIAQWRRLRSGVVERVLATGPGGTPGIPNLLDTEVSPIGTSRYFAIDLHIAGVRSVTCVFTPHGYRPGAATDAILYLHGHRGPLPIDRYWKSVGPQGKIRAPLREGLSRSTKNVVLIAPTLGLRSEAGDLAQPGGLDRYLDQALGAASLERLRHLIVASHSGGGLWMHRLAHTAQRSIDDNLRECWGFDCFNNPSIDATWIAWAARHRDKALRAFHATQVPSTTAAQLASRAAAEGLANVDLRRAERRSDPHWDMLSVHWTPLIDATAFLDAR
jgi:hypothetical protein